MQLVDMRRLRLHPFEWMRFLIILHVCTINAPNFAVEGSLIEQTIPASNSLACPGGVLQYTCFTFDGSLNWIIGSEQIFYGDDTKLNMVVVRGDFEAVLTAVVGENFTSTLTYPTITLADSGTAIQCVGSTSSALVSVTVADQPANCSTMSVIPQCQASTSADDETKTDFLVTLLTVDPLMCVVGYRIQFNAENKSVLLESPTANFSVDTSAGQPIPNEILVQTLDFENRTGDAACSFTILGPAALESISYDFVCDTTSEYVNLTFSWKRMLTGGCLTSDTQLQYSVGFNDSQFNGGVTQDTNYLLPDVPRGTALEITISPSLPLLGLSASAFTSTINLASIDCTESTSSETSSPRTASTTSTTSPSTTSTPTNTAGSSTVIVAASVSTGVFVLVLLLVIIVLAAIVFIVIRPCLRRSKAQGNLLHLRVRHRDTLDRISAIFRESALKSESVDLYPESRDEINAARSVDEVMDLLEKKCAFPYLDQFRALANIMALQDALKLIQQYEKERKRIYAKVLAQDFTHQHSSLVNEVNLVVNWANCRATLTDFESLIIQDLIPEVDRKKIELRKVCLCNGGLEFACAMPESVVSTMREVVRGELEKLRELNVISLTVGGETVYQANDDTVPNDMWLLREVSD